MGMEFTDRTTASGAEFYARMAPFDAAPEPEEIRVERVARAIEAACDGDATWQTLATAAIAALEPPR